MLVIKPSNLLIDFQPQHKMVRLKMYYRARFVNLTYPEFNIRGTVSGPIHKKSSISGESSSDVMDMEEGAMVADSHLEQNLRRLKDEEKVLLEQQATFETGGNDDIGALEHQDAIRLNHLRQAKLEKQQARKQRAQQGQSQSQAQAHSHGHSGPGPRREHTARRRACTVRVNNLHGAEAIETDVWLSEPRNHSRRGGPARRRRSGSVARQNASALPAALPRVNSAWVRRS